MQHHESRNSSNIDIKGISQLDLIHFFLKRILFVSFNSSSLFILE